MMLDKFFKPLHLALELDSGSAALLSLLLGLALVVWVLLAGLFGGIADMRRT